MPHLTLSKVHGGSWLAKPYCIWIPVLQPRLPSLSPRSLRPPILLQSLNHHTPASGFCMFLPSETFLLRCLFGSLLPPLEPLPSHHYDHPPLTSTCPTSGPLHSLSPYLASLSSTALNKLFVFLIYLFSLLSLECHSRGQIFVCLVHRCVPST